jgi:ATP-dependent Clp protease ATP-binding subunit ClpC
VFERFTDGARRVVVLALEESRLLEHNFIGTEHLLLGLIHGGELDRDDVAFNALETLNISRVAVREKVEHIVGRGGSAPGGHLPFTPRAKAALEFALREAMQLGHGYIGTEHILLGLIREGEGVAAEVLVGLGADLATARQRVIEIVEERGTGTAGSPGPATRQPTPPTCSFCDRPLGASEHYAVGQNAAICDECVRSAYNALLAPDDDPSPDE